NRLAVFHDIGNDEYFRVVRQQELAQNVDLQLPEMAAESDVLFRRQMLIPEDQHTMIQVSLMEPSEVRLIEWLGKSDSNHFSPHGGIERTYIEVLRSNI